MRGLALVKYVNDIVGYDDLSVDLLSSISIFHSCMFLLLT